MRTDLHSNRCPDAHGSALRRRRPDAHGFAVVGVVLRCAQICTATALPDAHGFALDRCGPRAAICFRAIVGADRFARGAERSTPPAMSPLVDRMRSSPWVVSACAKFGNISTVPVTATCVAIVLRRRRAIQ